MLGAHYWSYWELVLIKPGFWEYWLYWLYWLY